VERCELAVGIWAAFVGENIQGLESQVCGPGSGENRGSSLVLLRVWRIYAVTDANSQLSRVCNRLGQEQVQGRYTVRMSGLLATIPVFARILKGRRVDSVGSFLSISLCFRRSRLATAHRRTCYVVPSRFDISCTPQLAYPTSLRAVLPHRRRAPLYYYVSR